MITYDWKITALKKAPTLDGLSNVITHIKFDYTGTDAESGESHTFNGACPVGPPSADNFASIETLTEAMVIEWAKANHPVNHMNEVIEKGIKAKVVPTNEDVTELDWLAKETPAEPETNTEEDDHI